MKQSEEHLQAEIRIEIEFCSECPKSKLSGVYWNPDFGEEDQDIYCTELKCNVHTQLKWNEIKTEHQCARPEYDNSMDRVPENCPFLKKTSEQ